MVNKPIRVSNNVILLLRLSIHIISLFYLIYTLYLGIMGELSGDPVQYLLDFTGISSINLLLLSLSVSPLARYLKFVQIIRIRRTFGVYAAIYAISHVMVFISFELQFEWKLIINEIVDRPYITIGFLALLILTSLLITSLDKIKRKMGRSWLTLHKWTYVALSLAMLHYLWSIKSDELQPYIYLIIAVALLSLRKEKLNIFK